MICRMGKLFRTTDRILIGISLLGEVLEKFDEIRPSKSRWAQSAYGFLPKGYKKKSYISQVSRLLKSEIIEKVVVDGEAKLRISTTGKDKIRRDFSFFSLQNKKWDGKWRIVAFDFSVKKGNLRDKLRRKLKELGFGMLQQSIWITPHMIEEDIREFLVTNKIGSEVYVFVSDKILAGNIEKLLDKIWKISKVNNLYKEAFNKKDREIYFKALALDPFLPLDLLPKNWYGNIDVAKLFAGAK